MDVLSDDDVLDLAAVLGKGCTLHDMQTLLELPDEPLERVRSALTPGVTVLRLPLADVRLCTPVNGPSTEVV